MKQLAFGIISSTPYVDKNAQILKPLSLTKWAYSHYIPYIYLVCSNGRHILSWIVVTIARAWPKEATPNPIFPLSWNQSCNSLTTLVWVCAIFPHCTWAEEWMCLDGIIDSSPFWNFQTTISPTSNVPSPSNVLERIKAVWTHVVLCIWIHVQGHPHTIHSTCCRERPITLIFGVTIVLMHMHPSCSKVSHYVLILDYLSHVVPTCWCICKLIF